MRKANTIRAGLDSGARRSVEQSWTDLHI